LTNDRLVGLKSSGTNTKFRAKVCAAYLSYVIPVLIDVGTVGDAQFDEVIIAFLGSVKQLPQGSRLRKKEPQNKSSRVNKKK